MFATAKVSKVQFFSEGFLMNVCMEYLMCEIDLQFAWKEFFYEGQRLFTLGILSHMLHISCNQMHSSQQVCICSFIQVSGTVNWGLVLNLGHVIFWYGLFRVTYCVVFPFLALCNTVVVSGQYLSHAGDRISRLSRSWAWQLRHSGACDGFWGGICSGNSQCRSWQNKLMFRGDWVNCGEPMCPVGWNLEFHHLL